MTLRDIKQHPLAAVRHRLPWAVWLDGAAFAESEWIAPGLTVAGEGTDDDTGETYALISGVQEGETYTVTNRVTDSTGRQKDHSFTLTGAVTALETQAKDPDDATTVAVNYGFFAPGETVSSSTWDVPAGLTQTGSSTAGAKAVLGLSGGTSAKTYRLTNVAQMSGGETLVGVIDLYVTPS